MATTALTAAGFGLVQKLALHALAQTADLHLADTLPQADGAPVILHLAGEVVEVVAVTAPDEALPGENWGLGAAAPAVIGTSAAVPPGRRLSAEKLVELGTGNAHLLWPGPALDGPAAGFGRRFWDWLAQNAPLEAGAMRTAGVARLRYSDRYLLQAHTLRLLAEVLRTAPGVKSAAVAVDLAADDRPPPEPRFLHHNFPAGESRTEVLRALLPGAEVRIRRKAELPHYRALTAELSDGRRLEILLDQGFGAWRVTAGTRHDFNAAPAAQARSLAGALFALAAEQPSPPVAVMMT